MTHRRPAIQCFALCAVLVPAAALADSTGEAEALFDQGVADLKAGNVQQACNELAASLSKMSDSGTRGALATCDGKLGRIASAWQLWRELADSAPTAEMRASADQNAKALEPRLPRYVVTAPPIAGLVVTINGSPVDITVSVALPVDPGTLAISAKAPGYREWTGTAQASEGNTTAIAVPTLAALPEALVADDRARRARRVTALEVAIGGGASMVASLVLGSVASAKLSDAKRDCGGDLASCPGAQFQTARSAFDTANSDAVSADALIVIGGAAVAAAAVIWLTAPPVEERPRSWRAMPTADPHGAGLSLSGSW
jgi:hypothetical protein